MKTKSVLRLLFIMIVIFPMSSFMSAQNFQWENGVGGTQDETGQSVATDASGNVYITGYYNSPTITFGSTTFTNSGSYDIFLVKYDANGNVLWARSAPGSSYNYAYSVTTDCGVGNVVITGSFGGSITFGSTTLTNSSGSADIFIAEYDSNGNVVWAKSAGGSGSEFAYSVTSDNSCNFYITGYFNSPTLAFGSTTLSNTTTGWDNVFLAKYDMNGNVLWAKSAGGSGNITDQGKSVAVNNSGVYITGSFSSSISFGSTTLTSQGNDDIFLAKYDSGGNLIWAKSAGGTSDETGVSIAANSNTNNIYLAGNFNSPACIFNSISLTNASQGPFYYDDVFVAKYDLAGNVLWAKSAGGTMQDRTSGISMDMNQNAYLTGTFIDTITFDTTTLVNAGGNYEIFIAKYDLNGNSPWAKRAGGTGSDSPGGIVSDNIGTQLYVIGTYSSSSIYFDLLNSSNAGGNDIFLAKLIYLTVNVDDVDGVEKQNDISIFPNPSTGRFKINTENSSIDFSIYDASGKKIYSSVISPFQNNEIDISDKPDGVYYIRLSNSNLLITKKIIIQH